MCELSDDSFPQIVVSGEDREWMFLKLTGVTKYKFLGLISSRSLANLKAVTESIHISMPPDIKFSSMNVKVCKMRWLMKICVLISLILVNLQWFEYSIVSQTIISYYKTSSELVNWSSLIFMLCYVLFTFPVSYLLDNRIVNLRIAMILANSLLFLGVCIKSLSVGPANFTVAFSGQFLVGLAQVIVLNVPSQLAFEWFSVREKTLVCNLSIFGMQLGMLLGFAITPWLVENHENAEDIAADLNRLNYLHLGVTLFQLVLVVSVFRARPNCPPCYLQAIQEKSRCTGQFFWKTFRVLIKSGHFNFLFVAYGLQIGCTSTIFTLLNPMIIYYLPGIENEAGLIGVTIISASLFSSLTMTMILRRQKNLKLIAILAAALSTLSVILFIVGLLIRSSAVLYAGAVSLGFFSTAFQTVGYEFAFELTFPESDGTVGGVLNVSSQLSSILITVLVTTVYSSAGHLLGNLLLIFVLLVSISCLCFAKCELNRRSAYSIIDRSAKQLQTVEKYIQGGSDLLHEKTPLLSPIYVEPVAGCSHGGNHVAGG